MKIIKFLFLFICVGFNFSCKTDESKIRNDYLNNLVPNSFNGEVIKVQYFRGGTVNVEIRNSLGVHTVGVFGSYLKDVLREKDSLRKIANSNMCMVIRGDSLLCFDCYKFPRYMKDLESKTNKWERKNIKKWIKKDSLLILLKKIE